MSPPRHAGVLLPPKKKYNRQTTNNVGCRWKRHTFRVRNNPMNRFKLLQKPICNRNRPASYSAWMTRASDVVISAIKRLLQECPRGGFVLPRKRPIFGSFVSSQGMEVTAFMFPELICHRAVRSLLQLLTCWKTLPPIPHPHGHSPNRTLEGCLQPEPGAEISCAIPEFLYESKNHAGQTQLLLGLAGEMRGLGDHRGAWYLGGQVGLVTYLIKCSRN